MSMSMSKIPIRQLVSRRPQSALLSPLACTSPPPRQHETAGAGSQRLAWGAAASAVIALCGRPRDASCRGRHVPWCGRHGSARCESNGANRSTPRDGRAPPNSFFDMAQQRAGNYGPPKSNEDLSGGKANEKSDMATGTGGDSEQPLQRLLEAMGILGGGVDCERRDGAEESNKEIGVEGEGDDQHDISIGDLKGRLQRVLFQKMDEIQASYRKLPPSGKEGAGSDERVSHRPSAEERSFISEFFSFAKNAVLFTRETSSPPPNIEELIQQAQRIANRTSSSSSLLSQVRYFQQNARALQEALEASVGPHLAHVDVPDLFRSLPLVAANYYLEREESIKTPSWKRRRHRFHREAAAATVTQLNDALFLSELSYADTVEEVRAGLERRREVRGTEGPSRSGAEPQWELLFCDMESRANAPSHFLALQRNASTWEDALRVLVVVRGTKSISDLITDAMLEATPYECRVPGGAGILRGNAHSGMVKSGKYLVERHRELLCKLLRLSKKRKLEITLIGHSLGAGAIAALEFNSQPFSPERIGGDDNDGWGEVQVTAHAIGFGCPALLSRPLSRAAAPCVTSVVADADVIPRLSGATLINLLADMRRFDYRRQAERDVEEALRELQRRLQGSSMVVPWSVSAERASVFSISEEDICKVMQYVRRGLGELKTPSSVEKAAETNPTKMEPVLFPPGEWDGSGISGAYVPCEFFHEIDVARTMINDHLISSGYRKIFLTLMRDFHKDDHFSFDDKEFGK